MSLLNDCNDPVDQLAALDAHIISEEEFNSWVNNFFNIDPFDPSPVLPYVKSASVISDMVNAPEVTCSYVVELIGDDSKNNDDVSISVFLPDDLNSSDSYWPIILFKAFFAQISGSPLPGAPNEFVFSKAVKPGPNNTTVNCIVFQIVSVGGGKTYWDLSSTVPPKI